MEIGAGGNLRLLPRRRQEDRSTIPIASDPFGSRNRQAKTPLTAGLRMAVPVGTVACFSKLLPNPPHRFAPSKNPAHGGASHGGAGGI